MPQEVESQAQIVAAAVREVLRETAAATAQAVKETAVAAAQVMSTETNASLIAIEVLKTQMGAFKSQIDKLEGSFDGILTKLDEINKGRPSWGVAILVTLLSTCCGMMAVFIVTSTF